MRKTFSKLATLFFMIMLVFIGCTNPGQISFTDSNKNFNDESLSVLTMSIGSVGKTSRTILPGDWNNDKCANLMYRIYGKPVNSSDQVTVKFDENNSIFEFSNKKLMKGNEAAYIALDPIKWKFTLIAYEKNPDETTTNIEKIIKDKPVLIANAEADLTTGSKDVVFNLVPYDKSLAEDVPADWFGTEKNTASVGIVDINFKFDTPIETESIPNSVVFTLGETEFTLDDKGIANDGDASKKNVHYTTSNVAPGKYDFKAVFKNDTKVVLTYLDTVVVDAGNTSEAFVYLPKGAFKKPPVKPSNLAIETIFAPTEPITISEATKTYAQAVNKLDEIVDNKYNAIFSWDDNSTNETSFILTFKVDGTPIKVTYDCATNKATAEPDTYKVKETNSAPAINNVSRKSITMEIPTGSKIKDAEIAAYNEFSATDAGETSGSPIVGPEGKFTIAYKINDANGHGNAFVKYGDAPTDIVKPIVPAPTPDTSSKEYFVMAYDFVSSPISADSLSLLETKGRPYIDSDSEGCAFYRWNLVETTTAPEGTTSTTTTEVPTYDKVPEGKQNTNIVLIPSWFAKSTILVNFPTYSEYRDLLPVSDQNKDKTIKPTKGPDGTYDLKFTIPTYENVNVTNVQFTISDESSTDKEIFKYPVVETVTNPKSITADDTNLKIDMNAWNPAGGIYTIFVSYDYQKKAADTEPANPVIPVSGCFYLEINNNQDYTPTAKPAPAP